MSFLQRQQKRYGVDHPMHPAIVHFPITLFPLSALFVGLYHWQDNSFFLHAAYWSFMLGALVVLPVVLTGVRDWLHTRVEDIRGYKRAYFHIIIGALIAFISTISGIYFLLHKPIAEPNLISGFSLIAVLLTLLVFIQGFIGGLMVYTHHMGIEGHTTD
jgi:uncharacterized membrane protein